MIVFVHGVPETAAIWDKVRALVAGPSTAVSLPGFGCPRPDGFGATKDEIMEVFQLVAVLGVHSLTVGLPIFVEELKRAEQGEG